MVELFAGALSKKIANHDASMHPSVYKDTKQQRVVIDILLQTGFFANKQIGLSDLSS